MKEKYFLQIKDFIPIYGVITFSKRNKVSPLHDLSFVWEIFLSVYHISTLALLIYLIAKLFNL